MIVQQDHPDAFWLTLGMARVAGANLPSAVVEGWMTRAELDVMIDRCDSCGKDRDCLAWLARTPGPVAHLPGYCPNAPEIESLSPPPR